MPRAIVLGAGRVGAVIAADLAADSDFDVTVADSRTDALEDAARRAGGGLQMLDADLADPSTVRRIVEPFDIVLGALASPIGFQTLRAVIEAGRNFCDICFMPEDAWELDELARQHGVTAVVDIGVAPGMSNLMCGRAVAALDTCDNLEIYVGGIPRERHWPYEYKAGFSPFDVIEEYVRPARIVEQGKMVVREALSEPELMEFPGVGTLEAFNTDGLRSIAHFLDVPNMKEKTLRYPGHIERMRVFRETGLFSHEPIQVGSVRVRPIDVLGALLFPKWTYKPGEADLTVMRVLADGTKDGQRVRMRWDLHDEHDAATDTTSMARTTAFPCSIMARLVAAGRVPQTGVLPPERLGHDESLLDDMLEALRARGVRYDFACEPCD